MHSILTSFPSSSAKKTSPISSLIGFRFLTKDGWAISRSFFARYGTPVLREETKVPLIHHQQREVTVKRVEAANVTTESVECAAGRWLIRTRACVEGHLLDVIIRRFAGNDHVV